MGWFQWLSRAQHGAGPALTGARGQADTAVDATRARGATVLQFPLSQPDTRAPASGSGLEEQSPWGLDFAAAMQEHRQWKERLQGYLQSQPRDRLDHRALCRDDQCALGQWINGAGAAGFGHLPSFGELKASHGMFHQSVGRVVQLHMERRTSEALQELNSGEFSHQAARLSDLLSALYVEVSDTIHGSN